MCTIKLVPIKREELVGSLKDDAVEGAKMLKLVDAEHEGELLGQLVVLPKCVILGFHDKVSNTPFILKLEGGSVEDAVMIRLSAIYGETPKKARFTISGDPSKPELMVTVS